MKYSLSFPRYKHIEDYDNWKHRLTRHLDGIESADWSLIDYDSLKYHDQSRLNTRNKKKTSTVRKMVGSNGNLDFLARLTRGCGHKEQQRCKRKWLQIFAVFSSAQVHSERNNMFLTSDLDTLLRDAYGRFAWLLVAFPFVWKRNGLFANGRRIALEPINGS